MKRAPGVLLSRPVTSSPRIEAPQGSEEVAQEPPESGGGVERDILRIGRRLYPAGSPSTSIYLEVLVIAVRSDYRLD